MILGVCQGSVVYVACRKTSSPKYVVVRVAEVTRRPVFTISGSRPCPPWKPACISHSPTSSPSPSAANVSGGGSAATDPRVKTSSALPLPDSAAKERGRDLPFIFRHNFHESPLSW